MSPRKSSTSSARTPFERPRYLGLEAEGEPFPPLSPPLWEAWLRSALGRAHASDLRFRLVRSERTRAIVAVSHLDAPRARRAWNAEVGDGQTFRIRTVRTWGTLVGAKAWARAIDGPR